MSSKCVCHIGEYEIKDAAARKQIEDLNAGVKELRELADDLNARECPTAEELDAIEDRVAVLEQNGSESHECVEKTTTPNIVYGTDATGNNKQYNVSVAPVTNSIPIRNSLGGFSVSSTSITANTSVVNKDYVDAEITNNKNYVDDSIRNISIEGGILVELYRHKILYDIDTDVSGDRYAMMSLISYNVSNEYLNISTSEFIEFLNNCTLSGYIADVNDDGTIIVSAIVYHYVLDNVLMLYVNDSGTLRIFEIPVNSLLSMEETYDITKVLG